MFSKKKLIFLEEIWGILGFLFIFGGGNLDIERKLLFHARVQTALLLMIVIIFAGSGVVLFFGSIKVLSVVYSIMDIVNTAVEDASSVTDGLNGILNMFR